MLAYQQYKIIAEKPDFNRKRDEEKKQYEEDQRVREEKQKKINENKQKSISTYYHDIRDKNVSAIKDKLKEKPDSITTILDPYQMTYLKFNNKKILLFGEAHSLSPRKKPNPNEVIITDYLKYCIYLSYLNNNCIDMIIEQGFNLNQGYKLSNNHGNIFDDDSLSNVRRLFENCQSSKINKFRNEKSLNTIIDNFKESKYYNNIHRYIKIMSEENNKCMIDNIELNNLRVHNFDLRHFSLAGSSLEFYKLIHIKNHSHISSKIKTIITKLVSDTNKLTLFIKYILGYDNINNNNEAFIGEYINSNIIEVKEEINNETILTEFTGLREKMQKSYNKFKKTQEDIIPGKDVRAILLDYYIKKYVEVDVNKRSGIFITVFTDLYLIIRLLQKFDTEKMKRGPKQCQETDSLDKVCVYAGGFHINIVKDILILLFGEDIIHYSNNNNNKEEKKYEKEINFSESISNKGNFKDFSDIMNDFTNSESVV